MEIFLHRICGKTAEPPVPMLLRRCTAEEAPAVYALQNEVRAAMPHPEQFVPDTLENITAYVRKDLCIGAWQGSRLGGYLIVRFCGQSEHNYAAFAPSGSTGPMPTVPSSTQTFAATACKGSCWEQPCRSSRAGSPTSGPPSARKTNTA